MQQIILILLLAAAIGTLALGYFLYKRLAEMQKPKEGEQNLFLMLQNQINDLSRGMDQRMTETHRSMAQTQESVHQTMRAQFGESAKIIAAVSEKLARVEESNRQVVSFTDQIKNLEKVLTNAKTRGGFGEASLELILGNILPPGSYKLQYQFQNGEAVDAVIVLKDRLLPIDAKFSLDNYRRIVDEDDPARKGELEREFKNDLKRRIDETAKYIRPEEGTLDFAFMFIPAEGIYYDLLVNEVGAVKVNTRNLIDYAFKDKRVVIVSPTTFAAYLQTVLQGLRAMQIEESAKEIQKQVEQLGRHLASYEEYMKKMGNALGTTVNMYNQSYKEFAKIDKDVVKIAGGERRVEPALIEGVGSRE